MEPEDQPETSASTSSGDAFTRESAALMMQQSEVAELFDGMAMRRFGQCISAATGKKKRGRRKR